MKDLNLIDNCKEHLKGKKEDSFLYDKKKEHIEKKEI